MRRRFAAVLYDLSYKTFDVAPIPDRFVRSFVQNLRRGADSRSFCTIFRTKPSMRRRFPAVLYDLSYKTFDVAPIPDRFVRSFVQNLRRGAASRPFCTIFRTKPSTWRRFSTVLYDLSYKTFDLAPIPGRFVRSFVQNLRRGADSRPFCTIFRTKPSTWRRFSTVLYDLSYKTFDATLLLGRFVRSFVQNFRRGADSRPFCTIFRTKLSTWRRFPAVLYDLSYKAFDAAQPLKHLSISYAGRLSNMIAGGPLCYFKQ
jgi:hypothetical protein